MPEESVTPEKLADSVGSTPVDNPDVHLKHLLMEPDPPLYKTLIKDLKELFNPPKLPPLEVTSKPIPINEVKMYAGNETTAGFTSLLIHIGAIALLILIGSLKPVQKAFKEVIPLVAPKLDLAPKKEISHGGGGSPAPKTEAVRKIFTPPKATPPPTQTPQLITPSDVPTLMANVPSPMVDLGIPTNGAGLTGYGSGKGNGLGTGNGNGVGPGSGGGFGGGVYKIGGGVSQPVAIFKPEPEYSEEARKAKWQGTVTLSLTIDDKGNPLNIKVVKSLGLGLDEKAIEAVAKWRFKAAMKDGKPVAVYANVEVNFRLL